MMKIIAANHKANHSPTSITNYLKTLDNRLSNINSKHNIIVFPNQASLVSNVYSRFNIGAQNAYPIRNGAITGEIGLEVLESLNISHIMLGHSERRNILGESNEMILEKFRFFSNANMNIMLCIGENLSIKDVKGYLASMLDSIDLSYPLLSIAYEPIWAIGSGKTPSLSDIESVTKMLREIGVQKVLYGGSVNTKNVDEICQITDGVLVGGASLCADSFADLVESVKDR